MKQAKFCVFLFCFVFGNSRALIRELEEIDPRSFNNGEEDSGLSKTHTFVNDCSNSKLCPPSK